MSGFYSRFSAMDYGKLHYILLLLLDGISFNQDYSTLLLTPTHYNSLLLDLTNSSTIDYKLHHLMLYSSGL